MHYYSDRFDGIREILDGKPELRLFNELLAHYLTLADTSKKFSEVVRTNAGCGIPMYAAQDFVVDVQDITDTAKKLVRV